MSTSLYAETWRKLYQDYEGIVNFVDGDMESLVNSVRNYVYIQNPENANDYSESSEVGIMINALCYLGESIHYRVDFNAHDNFPLTTERKSSILNFAKFVSYAPQRLINASGIAKILQVSTTEDVRDSNNQSLKNNIIKWNDSTNTNWMEQFLLVLNSAFIYTNPFGKPIKNEMIGDVRSHLYELNSVVNNQCTYSFSANVNNTSMNFEVVNLDFDTDNDKYIERTPVPEQAFHIMYRTDGTGNTSDDTGFFVLWKQGSLQYLLQDFEEKIESQSIEISRPNITNDDVWVQEIDTNTGYLKENWIKIEADEYLVYNNNDLNVRNLYKVETNDNDMVTIKFGDGRFTDIPYGRFRFWFRTAPSTQLYIRPNDVSNVQVNIPYRSAKNTDDIYYLTILFSVQNSSQINQSVASETTETIRERSVELYSTQNRMVNGQDYNIYPLKYSTLIRKAKAANRTFAGHSRYIDFNDPTGMYKDINTIAEDGILYKEDVLKTTEELFAAGGNNVENTQNLITQTIAPLLTSQMLSNFYFDKYSSYPLRYNQKKMRWVSTYISSPSMTQGYFIDASTNTRVPTEFIESIISSGTMIRFVNTQNETKDDDGYKEVWVKVNKIEVDEDTSNRDYIMFIDNVLDENNTWYSDIKYNKFNTVLSEGVQEEMLECLDNGTSFGLTYDDQIAEWKVIDGNTLAYNTDFGFEPVIIDGVEKDPSWIVSVQYQAGLSWLITIRYLEYVFGSANNVKFFFNVDNSVNDTIEAINIKDVIKLFKINSLLSDTSKTLYNDYYWKPVDYFEYSDGYIDNSKLKITMEDSDKDGCPDNPVQFSEIINEQNQQKLFFYVNSEENNYETYASDVKEINDLWEIVKTSGTFYTDHSGTIIERNRKLPEDITLEKAITLPNGQILPAGTVLEQGNKYNANIVLTGYKVSFRWASEDNPSIEDDDDYLVYFEKEEVGSEMVNWDYENQKQETISSSTYTVKLGRADLIFQWKHYASKKYVVDPCPTNIIDIFALTQTYYDEVQEWKKNMATDFPKTPTSFELKSQFYSLNNNKMLSDSIVWHPIQYKLLFGDYAKPELRCKFAVVKGDTPISDNELKQYVIKYIDEYFATFDVSQKYYFTNLSTYIKNNLGSMINIIVPVPTYNNEKFGNLFEIVSDENEILMSCASVDNIQIISATTKNNIKIGN